MDLGLEWLTGTLALALIMCPVHRAICYCDRRNTLLQAVVISTQHYSQLLSHISLWWGRVGLFRCMLGLIFMDG